MRTRTQNAYILSLLFTLFSFIGTTHAAGKIIEANQCYLINSIGHPVDEKGKLLNTPLYVLEWKKENNKLVITKPSPVTALDAARDGHLRIINFSHTYQGKTPCTKRKVDMIDKWQLVQDTDFAEKKKRSDYWDLNITYDIKHNVMGKTSKRVQYNIYCNKTEVEVPDDDTPDTTSEKSSQKSHSEVKKCDQDGKEDNSCATANFVEPASLEEDVSQCSLD